MVKQQKLNIVGSLTYLADFFASTAEKMREGTATSLEVALADSFLHYDECSEGGDVQRIMEECDELYNGNPFTNYEYAEYPSSAEEQTDILDEAAEAITAFCNKLPEKAEPLSVRTTLFIARNSGSEAISQYEPFPADADFLIPYND
jgi:hypothetical protein